MRRRADPLPPSRTPLWTSPNLVNPSGGLRMPPRCSWALAPLESAPGTPDFAYSGDPPPRDSSSSAAHCRLTCPFHPSRQIRNRRPRLDHPSFRSAPLDPDPAAHVYAYRFAAAILLKSPPGSEYSTRSPPPLKNNYRLGLFYSLKPLNFPKLVPAVQHLFFYELDPRVNG